MNPIRHKLTIDNAIYKQYCTPFAMHFCIVLLPFLSTYFGTLLGTLETGENVQGFIVIQQNVWRTEIFISHNTAAELLLASQLSKKGHKEFEACLDELVLFLHPHSAKSSNNNNACSRHIFFSHISKVCAALLAKNICEITSLL